MNWNRGFLRVWIVFAVGWSAGVGLYAFWNWYSDPWWEFLKIGQQSQFWVYFAMGFGLPMALLGAGLGAKWIANGFRS